MALCGPYFLSFTSLQSPCPPHSSCSPKDHYFLCFFYVVLIPVTSEITVPRRKTATPENKEIEDETIVLPQ